MILLVALLVLGFVVAGCGDDENDGGGTTTEEVVTDTDTVTDDDTVTEDDTVTDDVTETDTVTEETDTEDSGGATPPPSDQSGAVTAPTAAQCKKSIGKTPRLSEDLKEELTELCEKGADATAEDRRDVCKQFAEEIAPDESTREALVQQCEKNVTQ